MAEIPISTARLVEDLRWLDTAAPPLLDGWGRNRCQWAAARLVALERALRMIAEGREVRVLPDQGPCFTEQRDLDADEAASIAQRALASL